MGENGGKWGKWGIIGENGGEMGEMVLAQQSPTNPAMVLNEFQKSEWKNGEMEKWRNVKMWGNGRLQEA